MKKFKDIFPVMALVGLFGTFGFGITFLTSTKEEKKESNGIKITAIIFIAILAIGLAGTIFTNPNFGKE